MTKKHLGQAKETMADLPQDLAEDVLCRLPMTDLKSVRLTCKTWNALSKDSSFTTKHLARQAKLAAAKDEFTLVLMMDYEILLVSVNFDENADAFMREVGTLINLDGSDQIDICISNDNTRLLVWNPYWGQSQWINPIHNSDRLNRYIYALGYDKSTNSHKILSFVDYTILNHFDYDAPPTAVTFAEYILRL
ncbi:hypothetical protein F2Q68_00045830 [Brassica cretica]|uniref:F-box domain-containing protein n=3 Tax=Brassica cretica TaxID=69181 RepID=A0ABQ7AMF7_BRACR|nr:hypothetical protein F2Q68_00045830 [Brassica cretica]KAF3515525.1 hypothetical protein DY000_02062937 [Brassica cretica]